MKNNMNITLFLLVASIVLAVVDVFIERETILWVFLPNNVWCIYKTNY